MPDKPKVYSVSSDFTLDGLVWFAYFGDCKGAGPFRTEQEALKSLEYWRRDARRDVADAEVQGVRELHPD